MARPSLVLSPPPREIRGIALLAHGGRERGTLTPGPLARPALRLNSVARHLLRRGRRHGLLVARLRYRVSGFNEGSPVEDVAWAIDALSSAHAAPVCLVGHSMGARASLLAAGAPPVTAVAALAPWCPASDPVAQLRDRTVLFLQGLDDRTTAPRFSHQYALRTRTVTQRAARFEIARSGHAMLSRHRLWHELTTGFVLGALALRPMPADIESALALPGPLACAVRV